MRVQGDHIPTQAQSRRAATSEDFPMAQKTIATLLILSAFAIAGANTASAEGRGFRGGGFHDGSGGFHGRGFHKRSSPVVVGGIVVGGIVVGGYGYADNNGTGNGYGDWYGISSGHDECPLFRKRVMTPDGWRIQMVPVC
jgi:hypothetical protein